MEKPTIFHSIFNFYREGFHNMTVGKTLWLIIIIKLFIMFVVLRIFFFPNYLNSKYKDDQSKAKHVCRELTNKAH